MEVLTQAYGHVTEEMKRNSAARMDEFIKDVKSWVSI